MLYLFADNSGKWKFALTLVILFFTASVYLYSTDPSFTNSTEFNQFKAELIESVTKVSENTN